MARNWMLAFSFPQMDGLTIVPLIAARPRSAITTNSLRTMMKSPISMPGSPRSGRAASR